MHGSLTTHEVLQQLLAEAKAVATTPSDSSNDKAELYQALLTMEEMLTGL